MPLRLDGMSSWKWFLVSFFGLGITFWIPDLIFATLKPNDLGYVRTFVLAIVLIPFYALVLHIRKGDRSGPSTAIFAIFGMWVSALPFTLLAQEIRSEQGLGGFSWGDLGYLLVSSFVPTRVFWLVGFEGSIFGLLLGTIAMINCQVIFERDRWLVPPGLWKVFRRSKRTG